MQPKPVYTVTELAALLGRSRASVYRLIKSANIEMTEFGGKQVVTLAALRASLPPNVFSSIALSHLLTPERKK